jgi:predicted nucleic acid-binding protein
MIFCVDSNIFVWGIKKEANDSQVDMMERAAYFFEWADSHNHQLLIPSIVIAEILAPEPIENYSKYTEIISKGFMVADFDLRTATKYAQILENRFENIKQLAKDNDIRREKMKFDHLIISCALVNGASRIYSHDPGLRTFASGLIEVKDLPDVPPKQLDLF